MFAVDWFKWTRSDMLQMLLIPFYYTWNGFAEECAMLVMRCCSFAMVISFGKPLFVACLPLIGVYGRDLKRFKPCSFWNGFADECVALVMRDCPWQFVGLGR